jgi:hypothetical protein
MTLTEDQKSRLRAADYTAALAIIRKECHCVLVVHTVDELVGHHFDPLTGKQWVVAWRPGGYVNEQIAGGEG